MIHVHRFNIRLPINDIIGNGQGLLLAVMEPKPVLSFFGDDVILGTVLKKKVQARFRQTQVLSLSKYARVKLKLLVDVILVYIYVVFCREDPSYSTFSSLCEGFEFIHFPNALDILKGDYPFYQRPALHTFWCGYFVSCLEEAIKVVFLEEVH